jgi:hypothetical protein
MKMPKWLKKITNDHEEGSSSSRGVGILRLGKT